MQNGSMFAFAGLWDAWMDKQGHWLQSFAIVTTDANELMAGDEDPRMPVILHARDMTDGWIVERWCDRRWTCCDRMSLRRWRCTKQTRVGNVRNNGPEML